ncbi:MAG: hypothetical protein AAFP23_03245 [Pseudomonadota bacterium]
MSGTRLPLWLLDWRVPLRARWIAFALLRARMRRVWMRVDPYFILTAIGVLVMLKLVFFTVGIPMTVANLLAGTAVALLVLIAALGALTKRSDRREVRAAERRLRMFGYTLTGLGRLVARNAR